MSKRERKGGNILSKIINKAIDLLPIELHIPGYSYCGPGTHLKQRLARNDKGINPLDAACKEHDIIYDKYSDSETRAEADRVLQEKAWQRFTSSDATLGEKAASYAVTTAMKVKSKFGGKYKRKTAGKKTKKKRKGSQYHVGTEIMKRLKGAGIFLRPYSKTGGAVVKTKRKKTRCRRKRN